ncbi:MAG: hypothetical protein NTW87_35665, partial [Planctomycetota bacterium]|nr:hypothetical protein [Planctomycetota bacterium]
RHGRKQADLKGDVLRAELKAVQLYRDERLVVPGKTTVCLVGGVDAKAFFAEAEKQLGGIKSLALPPPPVKTAAGNLDLTWDLDASHLILAWPLPDFGQEDYAALMAAAQWQTVQFCSDAELIQQTGRVFAGADLSTPEGNFFYVSASLRPGAAFAAVEKRLRACVSQWATNPSEQIALFSKQVSFSLTYVPDPAALLAQPPPGVTPAMIECNAGLQACMNIHRYGQQREALARMLGDVTTAKVRQAAAKYLTEQKCSVCTIHPATGAEKK